MRSEANRIFLWERARFWGLLAFFVCFPTSAIFSTPRLAEVEPTRGFVRWERPNYRNFSFDPFQNYPNHAAPYTDAPRLFYGPLGNELIRGYDLYFWDETRQPGLDYGSSIFKPNSGIFLLVWNKVYSATVVGRDGYGDWGYSLIVADGLDGRLSPLTLSMTDLSGFRLDLSAPGLQLTGLASRIERPHAYLPRATFALGETHIAHDSTLLLAGRAQANPGLATLGLNWANIHVYNSVQPGNNMKGVLRPDQPFVDWIAVRITDDSPDDGLGGAVVQHLNLIVNGEPRLDLTPHVLSHDGGIGPQVGRFSSATGRFQALDYTQFIGHRLYYRGRDEIPLYADYLYRLDHEAGVDVSGDTDTEGLVRNIRIHFNEPVLRVDGDNQLVFLFDLSGEDPVESVEVEAVMGGDYRVDVAQLNDANPRGRTYHTRYKTTFYRTVLRAKGNVRDRSNLRRLRFHVGEETALFTYSADLDIAIVGLQLNGEYARSTLCSRYPGRAGGVASFDRSRRFRDRGSAYYLNGTRWFGRGRVGAELFATNPSFTTTLRTFLDDNSDLDYTNLSGMINNTVYWDLVQDNDDGDRYPDRRMGNIVGLEPDERSFDIDGVLLGQDEDRDGIPDINRNLNAVADYNEPFLMYDVEPNSYTYGLDRNNNDEPDHREDDRDVDYPYDHDQRGYHIFGQFDLSANWSIAAGRHAVQQIAGAGRNRSAYLLLTYRRDEPHDLRKLFFENHLRRVEDDIADPFVIADERPSRDNEFTQGGLSRPSATELLLSERPPIFSNITVPDLLAYRDSYVNESYLEGAYRRRGFEIVQKLRLRVNWQRGGEVRPGIFQRQKRVDLMTWCGRFGRTWNWSRVEFQTQFKYMLFRQFDRGSDRDVQHETRSIPILRISYALLPRTSLRVGVQGFGPLPYRISDRTGSESFERRTSFATLTNRTEYFGYDMITIVGLARDKQNFDKEFQGFRNFDRWSFFVRGLVGFTAFGQRI